MNMVIELTVWRQIPYRTQFWKFRVAIILRIRPIQSKMGSLIKKVISDSSYLWLKFKFGAFYFSGFPKKLVRVAISQKDMVEFPKKSWWVNQHCNRLKLMWSDLMGTFPTPSRAQCAGILGPELVFSSSDQVPVNYPMKHDWTNPQTSPDPKTLNDIIREELFVYARKNLALVNVYIRDPVHNSMQFSIQFAT